GFASQTVGYSTESRARAGLEQEENAYLTASNKDLGTFFSTLGNRLKGTTITGNNVVLNVKVRPQRVAESLLRGRCGAAVALNPETGAVYAIASSPTYDPNLVEHPCGYVSIHTTIPQSHTTALLLHRATQAP